MRHLSSMYVEMMAPLILPELVKVKSRKRTWRELLALPSVAALPNASSRKGSCSSFEATDTPCFHKELFCFHLHIDFSFNKIPRNLRSLNYANYLGDVAEMSDNLIEAESLAGLAVTG